MFNMFTLVSKKDHAYHSSSIERGYHRSKYCNDKYRKCPGISRLIHSSKNCILTPEPCCDKWSAHQSKSCCPHESVSLWHKSSQTSHICHKSRSDNVQK